MDCGKIAKFVKIFSLESFPLYGISVTLCSKDPTVYMEASEMYVI